MKALHVATFVLMAAGALNWGLVGILDYNLVEAILGSWPGLVQIVYVLVGVSAVYQLATHPGYCKECASAK